MSNGSLGAKDGRANDLGVFMLVHARRPFDRSDQSAPPWWDASSGSRAVDDGPSWRVPPLWEAPSDAHEEFITLRGTSRGFPAYKRPWRQLVLF